MLVFSNSLNGPLTWERRAHWGGGKLFPERYVTALFLPAMVLEQQTELNRREIMTDTGACTDVVFGLFTLLGHRFSPRIANIGGARYWRIDPSADYGPLNGIARHRVNLNLIRVGWPAR
jgi:TnpA family transposase